VVNLRNLRLPELDKSRNVNKIKALVFDAENCTYDLILGADFLSKVGIDIKYSTKTIECFDNELPLRDPSSITNMEVQAMTDVVEVKQKNGAVWHGLA
jgi:hypothetical protein